MSGEIKQLTGITKAAIVLMAIGEECASKILSHLGPKDVQEVGYEMTHLKEVNREEVTEVLSQFSQIVDEKTGLTQGADEYVRKVMARALGEDKANNLMDRILQDSSKKGLETLKWMDPRSIAEIIRLEHPQIIAIVLSYLDHDQAADVMEFFNEKLRTDVLLRIANIDRIQPDALKELNEIMEAQFLGNNNLKMSAVGGVKTAAQILNHMDTALESEILDNIRELAPEIGQSIQDVMFVFDNLADLVDRDMQTVLREISSGNLVLALKTANDKVKQRIFNNMSKRAAHMLQEDLDAKGPVKIADVEAAQKEILLTVRRLAEAGEISLRAKVSDEYV
jgi:flagellar motor switch protein FliG